MTNRYLVGPNVDEILADENGSGIVTWSLADNLGSVRDLVQYTSGTNTTTVVNHVVYDTFGQIKSQTNTTWQPLFAYTGREWDADAGLYYYRARWYDSRVGRFLSEDPLGFAAGDVNLSRYVANSVTHNIDPTGMFDEPLPNSPNATPTIFEPSNQLPSGVGIAFPATASPPPPFSPLQGLSPSPDPSIRNLEQLHTRLAQESRDAYFRALHPMFLYGGDYQMTHRDAQMRLKLNAQYSPFGGMSPNYAKAYLEYHVEQLNAIAATEYYRSQQEQWLRAHLSTPWLTFAGNTDFGNNYSARAALQMRRELPDFRVLQKWDMEHWINLEFGLNYTHMSNHPWEPNASVQYGIQANDRINLSFGASQGPGATGLVPNLKITITPPTPAEIKSKLRKVLR